MQIRLASPDLQIESIVDGEGVRAVLWTQGCSHNCPGCHNPGTHSFTDGYLLDIKDITKQIDELEGHDGITLSGGDPMYQVESVLEIAKYAKKKKLNVWCYTGFLFEQLLEKSKTDKKQFELLKNIDVIIDGPFIMKLKSYDAIFRGSTNQRIIDVPKSLSENKVVLLEKYYHKEKIEDKKIKLYV